MEVKSSDNCLAPCWVLTSLPICNSRLFRLGNTRKGHSWHTEVQLFFLDPGYKTFIRKCKKQGCYAWNQFWDKLELYRLFAVRKTRKNLFITMELITTDSRPTTTWQGWTKCVWLFQYRVKIHLLLRNGNAIPNEFSISIDFPFPIDFPKNFPDSSSTPNPLFGSRKDIFRFPIPFSLAFHISIPNRSLTPWNSLLHDPSPWIIQSNFTEEFFMIVIFVYQSFPSDGIKKNLTHGVAFTSSSSVWSWEWEVHLVFRNGNTIPHGIFRIPSPFLILYMGQEIPHSDSQSTDCSLFLLLWQSRKHSIFLELVKFTLYANTAFKTESFQHAILYYNSEHSPALSLRLLSDWRGPQHKPRPHDAAAPGVYCAHYAGSASQNASFGQYAILYTLGILYIERARMLCDLWGRTISFQENLVLRCCEGDYAYWYENETIKCKRHDETAAPYYSSRTHLHVFWKVVNVND